jgi:hypothetical protein
MANERGIASWRKELAAAGFVLASGLGGVARAEPPSLEAEFGAFVGYHFGGGLPGRFAAGLEIRGIRAEKQQQCEPNVVGPFGAMAGRLAIVGWELQVLTAAQGGMRYGSSDVAAEVGLGYAFGPRAGLFVQPGLEASVGQLLLARAQHAVFRDSAVAIGARGGTRGFGPGGCVVTGRPLRDAHGGVCQTAVRVVGGPALTAPADTCTARAARVWADRAGDEWASVAAFEDLAGQLAACGAPASLVSRALAAGADEVRHAAISAAIAAGLGGGGVSVELAAIAARRAPAPGAAGLWRLVTESWTDGCLGEGTAAAWAAAEAETAGDAALRAALRGIAVDEAGHAQLAWDVLRWALACAPQPTRAALFVAGALEDRVPGMEGTAPGGDDLAALGCLDGPRRALVAELQRASARARVAGLLAG